ncbi:T9SS type A sorting domain-containing protein [Candidatus Cloacimonadota bacterium]
MKKKVLFVLCLLPVILSAQLMDMPEGISYCSVLDMCFVSCWNSENVVLIDSNGGQSEFLTGLSHCANNLLVGTVLYITYGAYVKAYDIFTNTEIFDIYLSGAVDADGLAMADDGFLYVVTHNNKVYKIDVDLQTSELFAYGDIGAYDQDMVYDAEYNRLLICSYQNNCPIFAVSLPDGEMSIACETGLNNLDGLATDADGNIYVACWETNSIYKYNNEFTGDPEIVSDGHNGPSGIEVNNIDNLLYVANFFDDTVDVVQLPAVGVEQGNLIEPEIELHQNYPNPFNPSTTISFQLNNEIIGTPELMIYNMKGQKIASLPVFLSGVEGLAMWDGKDENNHPVSSGIYFYKMKAGKFVQTKKMILMK